MGQAMTNVKGLRGGAVYFNNLSPVTMYDFAATADSSNARALIGNLYANPGNGGTPTRDALNYIGDQYMTNTNIIQYGCQRNAAFILTDGFANNTGPTPPTYDQTKWVANRALPDHHRPAAWPISRPTTTPPTCALPCRPDCCRSIPRTPAPTPTRTPICT